MGEKMSLKDFREKEMKNNSCWKFNLFDIVCKKCKSKNVEFNGRLEKEPGYYEFDGDIIEGDVIIKCHGCGNAFKLDFSALEK